MWTFKRKKKVISPFSNKLLKLKIKIMHCTKKMNVKRHASLINTIQYLLTVILLIFTSFFICNFPPQNIYTMITCLGHCCLTIRPSLQVKLPWVILQKQTQVYKYNCKKKTVLYQIFNNSSQSQRRCSFKKVRRFHEYQS